MFGGFVLQVRHRNGTFWRKVTLWDTTVNATLVSFLGEQKSRLFLDLFFCPCGSVLGVAWLALSLTNVFTIYRQFWGSFLPTLRLTTTWYNNILISVSPTASRRVSSERLVFIQIVIDERTKKFFMRLHFALFKSKISCFKDWCSKAFIELSIKNNK